MKFINKNTIKLEREINDLDKFVFKFIRVLEKHTDYVIISGYVSILLGRSRSTEDVDVFIKPVSKIMFPVLYSDLIKKGFWCLNAQNVDGVYNYLEDGIAVRFAEKGQTIPNFEVKFAKKKMDEEAFNDRITVKTSMGDVMISSLEKQVAFKRYYLKSDKDIEDAAYIEQLFKDEIDQGLIEKYKKMVESLR
ncbi:MAG: hypothetical protein KKC75_04155 [Nanoarchaeota archaeon]|nr:hypothetical protein [Nanoarchaeota archaeon]MBU1005349.1 hypothetical protein [Nanoarchaeota archaeon]MBU1946095.1 hypothetical protein [Nanoarchaeota archaeon]